MSPLTIGLAYETFETYPQRSGDPIDAHVEFEPESTIAALESAIGWLGHRPKRLGSPLELLRVLGEAAASSTPRSTSPSTSASRSPSPSTPSPVVPQGSTALGVDVVFNLAEGFGSRNREAWAPVLLEMAAVPTIGSDASTLSLTLDKAWANHFARACGVAVAAQTTFTRGAEALDAVLPADFPLFVKPRWEGTAKGIRASSRVEDREALVREVDRVCSTYAQPALVEAFVPGAEYTVTLIGNDPVDVLPVVQRALESRTRIGLHALEGPGGAAGRLPFDVSGELDRDLEARLGQISRRLFEAFECRDFARVDFRLDATGSPIFLEINPLPTFAADGTFAILAELEGIELSEMLARCVSAGLERLGFAEPGGKVPSVQNEDAHGG